MQGANYSLNQGLNYKTFKTEERPFSGHRRGITEPRPQKKGKRKKKGTGLRKQKVGISGERPKPKTTANTQRRTKRGRRSRGARARKNPGERGKENEKNRNPENRGKIHRAKTQERARTKQRLHGEEYFFYHCFRPCRQQKTQKISRGKRGRETGEKRGRQRNRITEGLKDEKQT